MDNESKTKEKKKDELLLKLKKEIKAVEKKIKLAKLENIKIKGIKSLKIFKHISIFLLPLIVTSSITIGGGYLLGFGLPFVRDNKKQKENIVKELDSQNTYRVERHYSDLNYYNQLLVCSEWILNEEENIYQRQVHRYLFSKYTEEDIINVINSGDLTNILEIIGEPYTYVEEKEDLTEEEIKNNDTYIQATLYSVNEDNIRVIKESTIVNFGTTLLEMVVIILLGGVLTVIVGVEYEINWKIRETINEDLPKYNVKTLKKQLAIRQENLDRIIN